MCGFGNPEFGMSEACIKRHSQAVEGQLLGKIQAPSMLGRLSRLSNRIDQIVIPACRTDFV